MPFVQIAWLEGRTTDQKRKIAQRITSALMEDGKGKQVTFVDLPPTNYASRAALWPIASRPEPLSVNYVTC